ncbi:MAG: rod shape-determining protein RodA [Patescibacteria group bacterium]
MHAVFVHIRRYDWLLMGSIFLLVAIGLTSLFSLSAVGQVRFFERQLIWTGIGVLLLAVSSFLDFRIFRRETAAVVALYAAAVVLLALVLVVSPRVRGIRAWLQLGGVALQPVELAKLSLVVLLAKFFSKRHVEIYRARHLILSGLYMAIPFLLVFAQPDPGSAITLAAIWVAVVLFSGMRLRHFFYLTAIGLVVASVAWSFVLVPYQKARITSFFDPYRDPKGTGYQMIQSMIAVGSGQTWGKGIGYGSQSHLHFLPEPHADFIFAAYAEEWGFVGSSILLGLFGIVLWRVIRVGSRARDNFSRLYTIGFAAFIFAQAFMHIGMNMGVFPITGITLPFVSYGGSSLVTLMIGVGIVQNIHINARRDVEE